MKTVSCAKIPTFLHLKKSTLNCWMKVHLWTRSTSWKLHIILWYKTSGRQTIGGLGGKAAAGISSSSNKTKTRFSSMNPTQLTLALALALTLLAMAIAQPQQLSHDHHDMGWVNGYRQGFNFQCPPGEVLVAIRSYYSQQDGSDRLWTFECQPTPEGLGEASDCWWDDINRAGMEW